MSGGKTKRLEGLSGVARAAEILRAGGIVAFPTETVYGLGANALDPEAVAKIFAAKERPGWDPLIAHVSDREMLTRVAEIPASAEKLMAAFWPGPLTLLLPRTAGVPDAVTAGRQLVGARMPAHPLAAELIRQAGVPVAAPSANRFGRTSPTTAAHVLADLDGRIDAILDGGPTEVGLESTVIGPSEDGSHWVMYRPGGVPKELLEMVLGLNSVEMYEPPEDALDIPDALPSPGVGIRHYAPRAKLILVTKFSDEQKNTLHEIMQTKWDPGITYGIMLPDGWTPPTMGSIYHWGPWDNTEILARRLFAGLRELDSKDVAYILCPVPAADGMGEAIRDRLRKAAREK